MIPSIQDHSKNIPRFVADLRRSLAFTTALRHASCAVTLFGVLGQRKGLTIPYASGMNKDRIFRVRGYVTRNSMAFYRATGLLIYTPLFRNRNGRVR